MRFFFDNNLSPRLARAIHELSLDDGVDVVHLRSKFPRDVPDEIWLRTLSEEGNWVVVSADTRIHRNPTQRMAWVEAGLTTFFLEPGWHDLRFWDIAWKLTQRWPQIMDVAKSIDPGACFFVPVRSQKLRLVR